MSISQKITAYTRQNDKLIRLLSCDPHYRVKRDGSVWTDYSTNGIGVASDEWRRCDQEDQNGYRYVNVTVSKLTGENTRRRRKLRVHRIVYQKFIGDLKPNKVVNHKNGVKSDNTVENLELIDYKENYDHAIQALKQSPIKNFRLSFGIAAEIRALKRAGWSHSRLAEKFGISKGHVSEIVNNKIWVTKETSNAVR